MKKIFTLRRLSQLGIIVILSFLTLRHMQYGVEQAASIDAYCPFGGVESLLTYLSTGEYLKRIYTSSFILLGIIMVLTLFFGRVFCSYLCPLGALQEWIRNLGRKLGIKKDVELPKVVDKYARYLKYVLLIFIFYYSYEVGDLFFRNYDPFNALMHLGEEFDEKVYAYIILGVVLSASLFSKSWWCRYFCPLGAFMGLIRKLSPFKLTRDQATCTACGTCNAVCPAGLEIKTAETIRSADCISCLSCVNHCPASSLSAQIGSKKIDKARFSRLVVVSFFSVLLLAVLTPFWETKPPSNIKNEQGEFTVDNLRGSNTLDFVLKETGIPLERFIEKFNLPQGVDLNMKLKDVGPTYNVKNEEGETIETEDFREFIQEELSR